MSLTTRDKKVIWHPYTHIKTSGDPIAIIKGEGAYLFDDKDKKYIDAISSWWVNIHGHSHPYIAERVNKQFLELEHVLFAGFTHKPAIELAEKLLHFLPKNQNKIFYSDNGSTAVEAALKMAIQFWDNKSKKRKKIIAFKDSFHGDTFGAMSVSERGAFTKPFHDFLFEVLFIDAPVPGREEQTKKAFESILKSNTNDIAAFIFEPIVQGAAGMKMYNPQILDQLLGICKENKILTIADEVMTGFGRTGRFFATDYLTNKPDIFCLSKGLTGGAMPLGVTSCTKEIFAAFKDDDKKKTFFHGHSFTANPLSCTAAIASLELFDKENTLENIQRIMKMHNGFVTELKKTAGVKNIRQAGTILAMELVTKSSNDYFDEMRDKVYNYFIDKGILLRPLGNTLYIMPPYCIKEDDLIYIYNTIKEFIPKLYEFKKIP
jgi:adenosylmethionine-8-amino-7-oxononanoate aminotransferase